MPGSKLSGYGRDDWPPLVFLLWIMQFSSEDDWYREHLVLCWLVCLNRLNITKCDIDIGKIGPLCSDCHPLSGMKILISRELFWSKLFSCVLLLMIAVELDR